MKISIPLIMSVFCLTLAGCGGSDSDNRSSSSSSSSVSSSSSSDSSSSATDSSSSSTDSSSSESSSSESSSSESSSSESSSSSSTAWTLLWSDEFDGEAINADIWEHEVNCWGGGNQELQCYTDEPANSYVSDGILHMVAIRETQNYCGPAHNQDDPNYNPEDISSCKPYTSARLRTKGKEDITYGRIEVRAKTPFGKGLWPAIWMLPTNYEYGGWPHSGEIDIFEAFSPGTDDFNDLNEIAGTLHYGFSWPWNQYTGKDSPGATFTPEANIWEEFHTYAVEWEEEEIRWYVDGHHYGTQTSDGWFSYYWGGQQLGYQNSVGAQPFDKAFHLLLNVAVGGVPGTPEPDAVFPQALEVEFVRVYECSVDPETGKGCATINPDVTPVNGHAPLPDTRDEVVLYQEGPQTLTFTVDEVDVTNTLVPAFWELVDGTVISNPAFDAGEDGIVWDIDFNGTGNAFLSSADMTAVAGFETGFNFGDNLHSRIKNVGEYKFDLKVLDIAAGTKIRIKLDSGWPNLSFHEIEVPAVGEWTEVSVRFYSLQANDGESWGPAADYTKVINPFVIEPVGGTAHVQLKNIRIVCLEDAGGGCDIKPVLAPVTLTESFDIFTDAVDPLWDFGIGIYQTGGGHVVNSVVDADEEERGKVIDVQFTSTQNGLIFIQSTDVKNANAFAADGYLSFDVKVLDYGVNTAGLVVKADCVNPCSSGDIGIGVVGDGVWETVTVPVSQMVTGGLNAAKVDTPFVLLPTWGSQEGVHLQLDNIRWVNPD